MTQLSTEPTYRALLPGERAARRTCPTCKDRHAAIINFSSGLLECRACGQVYAPMQPNRRQQEERRRRRLRRG